ncbi:MAG: topoisomerase IV [Ruminococcaceae bacterium]|nr:topoisomerase IV [Oscillospiraceae bacterium]
MAKKKKTVSIDDLKKNEAPATPQPITETLEKNYMPYAMSVIVSRAIPEIDGFKPSHRKLLYTMYKMGLMTQQKTKSANIVGQTMRLNPHGDASIYETMVRLTRGNGALLHPFIDSKGSFGKQYSRDMAYAASRYTEAKLDPFCAELFEGIDKDAVDFVPNYDNTSEEPTLLPTTFPNILVSPNLGIAVGMACSICSFNLSEICDGTIALLKNPKATVERIMEIIKAPDFSGGATILYDYEQMKKIYTTGIGSFKMQAKYAYDKKNHSIDILEIPYSSCIEAIIKKSVEMIKSGKLREVSDVRDSIDISSSRLLTFELKKDADPEIVIKKLMAATELENNFDCNFNILVEGRPMLLGVREILLEWIKFRTGCLTRELNFTLNKKEEKLHLLLGLAAILLDIDKAIKIIRNTADEKDVVPNLAAAFNISTIQAEYVADIKLRNLNSQYILNRVKEIEELRADIADIQDKLRDELKLKSVIIDQLKEIKKKYGKPRLTDIIDKRTVEVVKKDEIFFENYNCRLVMSKGGYFKKISLQGMRSGDEQKLKEGDFVIYEEDTDNRGDVIFITDKCQMYRVKVADFDLSKPSQMGEYIPAKLGMESDEHVIACQMIYDLIPEHHLIYIFENGKGLRVPMSAYESKSKRKKLTGICSSSSPLIAAFYEKEKPIQIFLRSDMGRGMLIKSDLIPEKVTRTSSGVQIMQFPKKNGKLELATDRIASLGADVSKCKKTAIPSTGSIINQISFNF